ncbi:RanBP1 domain protein, partial [Cooperia oncophora]
LFVGGAKPVVTVPLPVSSPAQPPKSEPSKGGKPEATTQAAPFSFGVPKYTSPATGSPAVSEAAKPATNIFAGIKSTDSVFSKTPETKPSMKKEGDGDEDEDHDHVEEYEPQVDFKPVCPLPELVNVVTGEEDEKVIFEERCKLYRYCNETCEWKERGTGVMKVLENNSTKKCRIVMRREQVLKVCANHQLLPGMTIQVMQRQEKAMTWYCEDFSEGQTVHEKLSARFASVEVANKFKEVFENAVKNAGPAVSPAKPSGTEKKEDKSSAKKEDETETEKKTEDKKEEKELDSKENVSQKGYGDQFKLQPGQWECPECYSRTAADKCPCCGFAKGGDKAPAPATSKSTLPTSSIPLGGAPTSEGQKFTFGLSAAAAAKASPPVTTPSSSSNTPKSSLFGASLTAAPSGSTPSSGFTFERNHRFSVALLQNHLQKEVQPCPRFRLQKSPKLLQLRLLQRRRALQLLLRSPSNQVGAFCGSSTCRVLNKASLIYIHTPGMGGSLFGSSKLFGASSTASTVEKKEEEKDEKDATTQPKSEQKVFGSGFGSNLSFASLAKSASGSIFDSAHTQKHIAEFAAQAKKQGGVLLHGLVLYSY